MSAPRKTRTLRLADGGQFRIGPGTVSVPVSTVPLDPPAVVLHVNRSCGALELVPDMNGNTPPPVRVDARRCVALVEQINQERMAATIRGEKSAPVVELPPTLRATAAHVAGWMASTPWLHTPGMAGYPAKVAAHAGETLWVQRDTGNTAIERMAPADDPEPGQPTEQIMLQRVPPRVAMQWLADNGYTVIPATLHRRVRTVPGVDDERQPPRRGKTSG
jgi:hypothetical protein